MIASNSLAYFRPFNFKIALSSAFELAFYVTSMLLEISQGHLTAHCLRYQFEKPQKFGLVLTKI